MAELALGRGLFTLVDDDDLPLVAASGPWRARKYGHNTYALRTLDRRCRQQFLHMFLTGYSATDHANGNGLDNRRCNLRPATGSQNQANRVHLTGRSGFRGVTWHKKRKQWQAAIKVRGQAKYLGLFSTPEEAARAYDEVAVAAWGEYARPNFPVRAASIFSAIADLDATLPVTPSGLTLVKDYATGRCYCGKSGEGPICDGCTNDHDRYAQRCEDL